MNALTKFILRKYQKRIFLIKVFTEVYAQFTQFLFYCLDFLNVNGDKKTKCYMLTIVTAQ